MRNLIKVVEKPTAISLCTTEYEKKSVIVLAYNFKKGEFSTEDAPAYFMKEIPFYKTKVIEGVAYCRIPKPADTTELNKYNKKFSDIIRVIESFELNEAVIDYAKTFSVTPLNDEELQFAKKSIEGVLYAFQGFRNHNMSGSLDITFSSDPEQELVLNLARTLSLVTNRNK